MPGANGNVGDLGLKWFLGRKPRLSAGLRKLNFVGDDLGAEQANVCQEMIEPARSRGFSPTLFPRAGIEAVVG